MQFSVQHALGSYTVYCERGALAHIGDYFALDRRVLIVTDTGVPAEYAKTVAKSCSSPIILTVHEGEDSKSLETLSVLCKTMLENDFTRSDCVVAVGGGVVGDLACFAASAYMRGIDFYNVPTTVLSAVDSSVGGKSGVNFEGVKNILGAFYQPKGVLFDADVLKTLPPRQISAGLAEAIKMALTFDASFFETFESGEVNDALYESLIFRAVQLKAAVVEKAPFDIAELRELMSYDELEIDTLGDRKTALFIITSDTDSTFDFVTALCCSQMFNILCTKADDEYGGRLPIHVRCLLDEFANIKIPDMQRLIAVIRSREISAALILQAKSQLKSIYKDNADTIEGNCDTTIFLGGKEGTTLKEISETLGKETIDLFNTSDTRGQSRSYGINYQKTGKELMSRDELAVMPRTGTGMRR